MKQYILFALLLFACLFTGNKATAQSGCYVCNYDSLQQAEKKAATPAEKVRLLTLMIGNRDEGNKSLQNLDEIMQLSAKVKSFDATPYRRLRDGLVYYNNKDWAHALASTQQAVQLFDKQKAIIVNVLSFLRIYYNNLNQQEERLQYYRQKLAYYQVHGPIENMGVCYFGIAGYYYVKNDFNNAISYYLKSADIAKSFDNRSYLNQMSVVGNCYEKWGNDEKAQEYVKVVLPGATEEKDSSIVSHCYRILARIAVRKKSFAEARNLTLHALQFVPIGINTATGNTLLAEIYLAEEKPTLALPYLTIASRLKDSLQLPFYSTQGELEVNYAYYLYYKQLQQKAAAEKRLLAAYHEAVAAKSNETKLKYLRELSLFYASDNNAADAYKYSSGYFALQDSLDRELGRYHIAQYENERKEIAQNNKINALKQEAAIREATIHQRNIIIWISAVALLLICASMFFLYRQLMINRRTLETLRKTQTQLIQQEKMASLGELTAGIAHEIQNPLNFVNNFSEVSTELVEELKGERAKVNGERDEELESEILNDLSQNLIKIHHHGKRADAIVKGMLEHSRTTKGEKQLTDLNALADEYLRLSYHGLRAKDKDFNATIETDFDESIGKIEVVAQDIGRVLLNLYNNAFHAVSTRKKTEGDGFKPIVKIETKKIDSKVEVVVTDNGNGIPHNIIDKIFQPFFTTKPAGQGTGLGLSLSYDIVKAHGGEITVESKEGEGSTFIIQL
jgi:signal transduction histidine kinase